MHGKFEKILDIIGDADMMSLLTLSRQFIANLMRYSERRKHQTTHNS